MSNINKYIYKTLITLNATKAYLYKHNDIIYSLMNVTNKDGISWIDLYSSSDNGDTWTNDNDLPSDSCDLYDAKMIIVNDIIFIFAHGINSSTNIDQIKYIKRSSSGTWDSSWSILFPSLNYHNRLTDLCVDNNGTAIHIVYDRLTSNNKYCVCYANLSTSTYEINVNQAINNTPAQNQHNAKILTLNDYNISISWEQENTYSISQIYYVQYNFIEQIWSSILKLSSNEHHNNYHHSMTKDSYDTVHVAWLYTDNSFNSDSIKYCNIVDFTNSDELIITTSANNNEYPYILNDEQNNLYVLYNLSTESIQYLTLKNGSNEWTNITNLSDNNLKLLYGYCVDNNIYTISIENKKVYFVRIDTDIAEQFIPVNDFQISSLSNSSITFNWTKARNAEKIYLESLNEDKWENATLVAPLSVNDTSAYAISLPEGKYKFRIKYTQNDGIENIQNINGTFINEYTKNIYVTWSQIKDISLQTLQFSKETWTQIVEIPSTNSEFTQTFNGEIKKYRLNVVGGMAAGTSNEIQPLTIKFDSDENIVLSWNNIQNVTSINIQQSIDHIHWYSVTTEKPISLNDLTCTIKNLNKVIYYFRILFTNSYGKTLLSNEVVITNNLKTFTYSYDYVTLNWNDIVISEQKKFQYSFDNGINWITSVNPINDNLIKITNLDYDTKYLFRIYFPTRFTGIYSNIISLTTLKKPINDLKLTSINDNNIANFSFSINEKYESISVNIIDQITKNLITYDLDKLNHDIQEDKYLQKNITFSVKVEYGHYYEVYVIPNNSKLTNSNIISFNSYGYNPSNVSIINIKSHNVTLKFNALKDITNDLIPQYVYVLYSYDNVNWNKQIFNLESLNSDSTEFTLTNLMQNTMYYAKMVVKYGYNYGESDIVSFTTAKTNFNPLYGLRLPGERSFCFSNKDNVFYAFDKGILYSISSDNTSQNIICDYRIQSNHVYSSMKLDNNGYVHLVFSYGKYLYYVNNALDEKGIQHSFNELITLRHDDTINEILCPDISFQYNHTLLIVWEENYGYYSKIMNAMVKNSLLIDDIYALLDDKTLNHYPKIASKSTGGYYVVCINDDKTLFKVINMSIDYDITSTNYLNANITITTNKINDDYTSYFNNFSIGCNSLDDLRIFYDSINDSIKTSTFLCKPYSEDSLSQEYLFGGNIKDVTLIHNDELIMIGVIKQHIYTAKYSESQKSFSDVLSSSLNDIDDNPLCLYSNDENVYILSFNDGEFLIQTILINDIKGKDNYVNSIWTDNVFSTSNDDVDVNIWTNGDINNYPNLFMTFNKISYDISPRNSYGSLSSQIIKINSLDIIDDSTEIKAELSSNNIQYNENIVSLIKIKYNTNKLILYAVKLYSGIEHDEDVYTVYKLFS